MVKLKQKLTSDYLKTLLIWDNNVINMMLFTDIFQPLPVVLITANPLNDRIWHVCRPIKKNRHKQYIGSLLVFIKMDYSAEVAKYLL